MSTSARFVLRLAAFPWALCTILALGQTQTTGQITGTIRDSQGAVIVNAAIHSDNTATGERRTTASDTSGNYALTFLPADVYELTVSFPGFATGHFQNLRVSTSQVTSVNVVLSVASTSFEVTVSNADPLVQADGPQLATELDAKTVSNLPLPTRNVLQLLTLAPGVTAPLSNNNAVGRNSQNVSVNGARVTQNNYRVNGVDANDIHAHVFYDVAVPAPESINEVKIQTSLYDASVQGGGGSVQLTTKSGTNLVHGAVYEYSRNEVLNANDANLNAVGDRRPVMRRNVYGATLGGPLRRNRAFFFVSYQGIREANANEGLYKSVLIAPGLTDDRSTTTLINTFGVASIHAITLELLNVKLPNGKFLIPTPQTPDGRVTGAASSIYHEEQFNTNIDYRASSKDSFSGKFFFAQARLFNALGGSSFPGFGTFSHVDNHVLSLENIHTFSPRAVNEARLGYSSIRNAELPEEPVEDSSIGMQRSTAAQYPGLPFIVMGRDQGGAGFGTPVITLRDNTPALSFADVLWTQLGKHKLRVGGEIIHSEWRATPNVLSYGTIEFPTFEDFLIGNTGDSLFPGGTFGLAHLGTGLTHRNSIATDYHLFIQDDWKIASNLTVNLGLRYELDPPPYDSRGRIGGFDPELYRPRMQVDENGFPVGPPAQGIIEAGNALRQYNLPGVVRVGKHILKSIDPNNFGLRAGLTWSPLRSDRLAVRAGYGIFFARPSFFYLAPEYFYPPFFLDSETSGQPFSAPFANAPPDSSFPLVQPGSTIATCCGWPSIDRNARTPYVQQFNTSLQYGLARNTTLQIAYAGTRGVKLFRSVGVNQARIASLRHPITNVVTGQVITDNTIDNAPLRAPMQAVEPWSFNLNQSTAQSTYHSLQTTLNRRFSHGLQFSVAYTLSKSIDNGSTPGGGAQPDGSIDRGFGLDSSSVLGNQLNDRSNRGISDFDRTHYFGCSYVWDLPEPGFAHGAKAARLLLSNWQLSGIVTAMSGLPVDILDPVGGSLYGISGARPNWAPGASRRTAMQNVPSGYYFNPAAFTPATVQPGQAIPSAHDSTAIAPDGGTDFGNVGRNVLRGPSQSNFDFSVAKQFPVSESQSLQFRAEFFNLLNHANRDNPVSDISNGDFGKIVSFSSSPRIVQLSIKFNF